MEDAYKTINHTLVNLINEIWELEEKAIITEEFQDLTNNDMHVIEAIGPGDGNNMSSIAKKLNITVGSLTTAMNSLVNKTYVERRRSETDRRVVYVKLTEKGIRAYRHHEDYHRQMTQAIIDKLDEAELPVLVKTLDALTEFFTGYSKRMVKGVIFDMDGLMFDTERLSTVLWAKAGSERGVEIPETFVDRFRGRNPEAIRKTFLEAYGTEFDYEGCRELKDGLVHQYIEEHGVPVKRGLRELLAYLKESGIRMAVATSTQRDLAEKMLKLAEVYSYFDTVVYGDLVRRSKPAPDIFQKAAEELGVESRDCLVLEDSVAGIMAGKAAGGWVIHIPDVMRVPEEVKEGITAEYESLDQVIDWFEQENKK